MEHKLYTLTYHLKDFCKALFQRIWSEEDEIVILKGLAEYSREKASDPMADLTDFLNFIKGGLNLTCTHKQLKRKIGSLQKKYKTKEMENSVQQIFSIRHKQKAYDLSEVVWGDSVLSKRDGEKGTGLIWSAEVVRGEEGESSCGLGKMVERAWKEICTGEGNGEWKKKLRAEDVQRQCKELEEKLLQSRFVLYVLK